MTKYKNPEPGEVLEYIQQTGLEYKEKGDEIMFPCLEGCDDDDRESEKYHCSINAKTGQFHCFKCQASGNLITLRQKLGDVVKNPSKNMSSTVTTRKENLMAIAKKCHTNLMNDEKLRNYIIKDRGIDLIRLNEFNLGLGEFYDKKWLTIPIIENGECRLIKLRRLPSETEGAKYMAYPTGAESVLFGMTDLKKSNSDSILICGGEYDRIVALTMGFDMPVVTSTAGEGTFKRSWVDLLDGRRSIYICLDNDKTGEESTLRIAKIISNELPNACVYKVPIPTDLGEKADLTDAHNAGHTGKDLLENAYQISGRQTVIRDALGEMSISDLASVLDLTIKHDYYNKIIVFLAMLSMYTNRQQMNISLNGRSSSGKTYIAQEVAKLFPKMDYVTYNRISPTGLFHLEDERSVDENGDSVVDLERKTLILLDQVGTQLQQNLRPLLSHDEKMLRNLITNPDKKGRNVSKHEYIKGFCATIWCSANLRMDEQEQTRLIILSPEISETKLNDSLEMIGKVENDSKSVDDTIKQSSERNALIDRIYYVRDLNIGDIEIPEEFNVVEKFKATLDKILPRHQRDLQHVYSLIKAHTLLNAPTRELKGEKTLVAKQQDVDEAFEIWRHIRRSQSSGVPAQVLQFYDACIVPAFLDKYPDGKGDGVTYEELQAKNYAQDGEMLNPDYVRKQMIPILKTAGYISEIRDPSDGRRRLFKPMILFNGENLSVEK